MEEVEVVKGGDQIERIAIMLVILAWARVSVAPHTLVKYLVLMD
jgi:hypothetical protein